MAKNARKKTTKKPRAAAKKTAVKTKRATRASKTRAPLRGPVRMTTGRGSGPAEIGGDLVAMFNRGEMQKIEDKWYAPNIVSVEGAGVELAWHGRKAVQEKSEQWMATHRIHGASAEGPYVGASGFAVKFAMDVEDTVANERSMFEEVGVYTVENGRIVREEFMYGKRSPIVSAT